MSKIEALYTLEIKDKNGKTVSKVIKPCKSFVLQFLQILEIQLDPANAVTLKDVAGANKTCDQHANSLNSTAPVTNDTYGMMVGTGTTPVVNADYVMETKIVHGVGAGELQYGASSIVTAAEVGANVDLQLIRTFTNGSGNTINVTEIGIISLANDGAAQYFLTLHEIVTLTAVTNGQTLTVTITFRTTV